MNNSTDKQTKSQAYQAFVLTQAQLLKAQFSNFTKEQYLEWRSQWKKDYQLMSVLNRHYKATARLQPGVKREKADWLSKHIIDRVKLMAMVTDFNKRVKGFGVAPYSNRAVYLLVLRKAAKLASAERYKQDHMSSI